MLSATSYSLFRLHKSYLRFVPSDLPLRNRRSILSLYVDGHEAMATITSVNRMNSDLSTEERKLVRQSTADFINEHVTQPYDL
jgi:hypothetical protein